MIIEISDHVIPLYAYFTPLCLIGDATSQLLVDWSGGISNNPPKMNRIKRFKFWGFTEPTSIKYKSYVIILREPGLSNTAKCRLNF